MITAATLICRLYSLSNKNDYEILTLKKCLLTISKKIPDYILVDFHLVDYDN